MGLAVAVGLPLAAELVARAAILLAGDPRDAALGNAARIVRYDPALHWRPRAELDLAETLPDGTPCRIHTNDLGLRDDPFPGQPEPTLTVLCLGDSSTWGDGVGQESSYAQVLEHTLASALPGERVSVLNAGVPGYSSAQSLLQARRLLARYHFDFVTISNLPSDVFLAAGTDAQRMPHGGLAGLATWVCARSVLADLLRLAVLPAPRTRIAHGPGDRVVIPDMVNRVPARPDFEQNLRALVEAVRAGGAEPLLMIPLPFCMSEPCPRVFSRVSIDGSETFLLRSQEDAPAYRQVYRDVAAELGVRLLDLASVRDAEPAFERLYVDEVHPSAEGHAQIARALAPLVLQAR